MNKMSATASLRILLFLASCSSSYVESYQPYEVISEKLESYPLPKLNYNYNELEPFIDEATMKVHHTGHHAAYTKKMNSALKEWKESVSMILMFDVSVFHYLPFCFREMLSVPQGCVQGAKKGLGKLIIRVKSIMGPQG